MIWLSYRILKAMSPQYSLRLNSWTENLTHPLYRRSVQPTQSLAGRTAQKQHHVIRAETSHVINLVVVSRVGWKGGEVLSRKRATFQERKIGKMQIIRTLLLGAAQIISWLFFFRLTSLELIRIIILRQRDKKTRKIRGSPKGGQTFKYLYCYYRVNNIMT